MRAALLLLLAACQGGDDASDDTLPEPSWPTLACDPIDPDFCAFPFPSNVFTVDDPSTVTGRRVALSTDLMPVSLAGNTSDPAPWNQRDGFSPGSPILVHLPGATLTGVADSEHVGRSLDADSPTVLLDVATGERIPHFVDLDANGDDDRKRALILRPAVRLRDAARYVVALRGLVDAGGALIPASEAFTALRDGTPSDEPSVDARRDLYRDLFAHLDAAGVPQDDLQLAWDFTTASREDTTGWMVAMRDDALSRLAAAPEYTLTSVEEDYAGDTTARRVYGTMKVPLYLTQYDPGGRLIFGEDGAPVPNPDQPWVDVPFEMLIPNAALESPGALLQYGHGLFGEKEEIQSHALRVLGDERNLILFSTDLIGMASEDEEFVGGVLLSGHLDGILPMMDRLHQGFVNELVLMRVLRDGVSKDPDLGAFIDPEQTFYHGNSQGGIGGAVYMALTTDVQRGVLEVMGQPYSLLLSRSVDFDDFFLVLNINYPDPRDVQLILALVQMVWDRVEPNGYTASIVDDPLPGTPTHEVLLRAAIGDHQVTTLGAHVMARTLGAVHVGTGLREVWGLEAAAASDAPATYLEYSFDLPDIPSCNQPMRACDDPHDMVRDLAEARAQLDHFLRTGESRSFCEGACLFEGVAECSDGDRTADPDAVCPR